MVFVNTSFLVGLCSSVSSRISEKRYTWSSVDGRPLLSRSLRQPFSTKSLSLEASSSQQGCLVSCSLSESLRKASGWSWDTLGQYSVSWSSSSSAERLWSLMLASSSSVNVCACFGRGMYYTICCTVLCVLLRETTNALIVDDSSSFSAGTCVYFSTCCIKNKEHFLSSEYTCQLPTAMHGSYIKFELISALVLHWSYEQRCQIILSDYAVPSAHILVDLKVW